MRNLLILLFLLLVACTKEYTIYENPEVEKLDLDTLIVAVVQPGCGECPQTDAEIIQAALDTAHVVHLSRGLFHLDTTIDISNHKKLLGEGITERYPDEDCAGTAIEIGDSVTTLFKVSGYNVEVKGIRFTGTGKSLESIIEVQSGGNLLFQDLLERDIKWYAAGWQKAPYTFIRFTTTSNTIAVDRVFSYDANWFIRFDAPVYFFTMKDGRCIWTDNGVYIGNGAVSFNCENYAMEQIEGPAFQIAGSNQADFHFSNIHNEWAWPFIQVDAVHKVNISIDGFYGWGYKGDEINLIEITSNRGQYINIKNSFLYGLRGDRPDEPFPIKDWPKYSYGTTLDNVKIKDPSSHKYQTWNKFPDNSLDIVADQPMQRLLIHADQYNNGDSVNLVVDPENKANAWEFTDSTQYTIPGDWSFLGNSEGHFVIVAEPNKFNTHISYLFKTGTENGVRLYFQNARLFYHLKNDGANLGSVYQNGYPEGLTHCIIGSQEIVNDSLHFNFLYDNFEGYTNHSNYDILEFKVPVSDLPAGSDHTLHIGDSTGLSIDGNFTLAEFGESALSESEMYEIIYSLKKHYNWQHSNGGLY